MKRMSKTVILIVIVAVLFSMCAVGLVGCDFFGLGSSDGGTGTPSSVKVTLDLNGGTGVNQLTLVGKPGDPMTLQSPTRAGFTFDRWYRGYSLIDTTVFPREDTLLTARYYCNESYAESTSFSSSLNKVLGGSGGSYCLEASDFDERKIKYLQNNTNVRIKIDVELEAYCSTIGAGEYMGAKGYITLTGASKSDAFSKVTVQNYREYQSYRLNADTTSAKLVGGNYIIYLVYSTSLGSTDCYFRNVLVTISYNVAAGSLV